VTEWQYAMLTLVALVCLLGAKTIDEKAKR